MLQRLLRALRRAALALTLAGAVGAQTRVACLGDSITEGARLAAPERDAPPAQLALALAGDPEMPNYEVRGFGAGGHTLRATADRPYAASRAFRRALEFAPDIAIVMLGTNDSVLSEARPNWLPEHDMTRDVMALVEPLREANAAVRVLLASPPTMLASAPGLAPARRADLLAREPRLLVLAQHLREITEALEGVEFVDMTRVLRAEHVTDGVHPNASGAQRIAQRLVGEIRLERAPSPEPIERLLAASDTKRASRFHGFRRADFTLTDPDAAQPDVAAATLVAPDRIARGRPWIWRARFFGHEPALDLALLERGYHLAYVDVGGLFGAPRAVQRMARLQDLAESIGLGPKPILEGMSRGGLAIVEYAKRFPERVGAVYGDNPVCDIRSWPGGRNGQRSDGDWAACLAAWGLDEVSALAFEGGPLSGLEPLAAAGVPLYLVLGLADKVVPAHENGERLAAAYAAAGGEVKVWRKPGLGHHPHGLDPVDPLLDALLRDGIAGRKEPGVGARIDAYVDARFEAPAGATEALLESLRANGLAEPAELERALRARRASYPDPSALVGKTTTHPITCYHVDYSSVYRLFVPANFDPARTYSLVVVGHGGNSSMSAERALRTADQYLGLYAPGITENLDAIVVAPASERGWGPIGYSLVFSTIADVARKLPIDPDRVYVTGQSMGGHLAYRIGMLFPDAFGAISPHSGGYDFVEKGSIGNLVNVPGMAIFGSIEPFGINGDNKTNAAWCAARGLDWRFIEKDGGHTIYRDELPAMAAFFQERPRNLYRDRVFFRRGGALVFQKTWEIDGWPTHVVADDTRPLRWNRAHWVEVEARDDEKEPQEVLALNRGGNRIDVTCSRVRQLRLYFHPRMVDFERPVVVTVNGEPAFEGRLRVDMALMLDDARRFDDRGRVFWAAVDLAVTSDRAVVLPPSK